MKALTLTQPYATLVAIGAKKIETRSWKTSYRGKLAIHAAKGLGMLNKWEFIGMLDKEPFESVLKAHFGEYVAPFFPHPMIKNLPGGAIVAICDLVAVKHIGWDEITFPDGGQFYFYGSIANVWHLADQERAFGNYTPGRYAWLLANVKKLETPIPAKGALGLWDWTPPPNFPL